MSEAITFFIQCGAPLASFPGPPRFTCGLEPHSPRAATGLRCGGDALERNRWPRPSHSLTACSSFLEREESPLSRSLVFSEIMDGACSVQRYCARAYPSGRPARVRFNIGGI